MIFTDIQQVFSSTSSLTYASYFSDTDQAFLQSDYTMSGFPFGQSSKDYIEISVFALDGTPITTSFFIPSGSLVPYSKSFYDVNNTFTTYSYSDFQSDMVILGQETQSAFLDVAKQLDLAGIQAGSYIVGIQLIRDIVGSSQNTTQRLRLSSISPSRTELTLIPVSLRSADTAVNREFYSFANNQVLFSDVADPIVAGITNPNLYTIYTSASAADPTGSNSLLADYGYKTNVDIINFLIDTFYGVTKGERQSDGQIAQNNILGIFDQFSNWLDQNYTSYASFQDIQNQYYSLFSFIINQNLNGVNGTKSENYGQTANFLQSIYYNTIFYPVITHVENDYVDFITGYFKNFLNFGDDRLFAIMNTKIIPSADPTMQDQLAIKLTDALPNDLVVGDTLWIENTFASPPILQNVYYYANPTANIVQLRGPNFFIKVGNEGNGTETVSIESLIGETGSLYTELFAKLNAQTSASTNNLVDYRYFENFVNFSTADIRIQAYDQKTSAIAQLQQQVIDLNNLLTLQPDDTFYQADLQTTLNQISAIQASFDGYETFLTNNPSWYATHTTLYDGVSSASLYDEMNQNSLVNGIPDFIAEDSNNVAYVTFGGMIGHYFDNLSLFINQFTRKNDPSSSPNAGAALDTVYSILLSLGWDPEISRENLPLLLSSFSKSDFSSDPSSLDNVLYNKVGLISEKDRNQLIWKRILNNLPFIYKTKGTVASINALISCFGIPKNVLKIKEYGSIDYNTDMDAPGIYTFEENKYLPYFSGSGEYFQLPWTGSISSVEFDLNFDTSHVNPVGTSFQLISGNSWVVGAYREKGEVWGRLFLSVFDGTASYSSLTSPKVPLFDGSTYTVLLRRDDVGSTVAGYPTEYELLIRKSTAGRITYETGSSFVLAENYNNTFATGSTIYVGNYNQGSSSFSAFWGNIDEIKLWEIPIDNVTLDEHALYRGGFSYDCPQTMVDKLLFRASFGQPIDLYATQSLPNVAFRGDFPMFSAINFPPVSGVSPIYPECNIPDAAPIWPFQFTVEEFVTQAAKVSAYGSQALRSNKIAYFTQTMAANLSPTARATQQAIYDGPVDTNKIGVFFSPIDIENEAILKFFGAFDFGDLIGDPAEIYCRTYRQFERFREIYYAQGLGIVDYQTFMNTVKAYFDKAMFRYMNSLVPARSQLVEGILIEPTILERPKLQLKPVGVESITQLDANAKTGYGVSARSLPQWAGSASVDVQAISVLNDANQMFYPDMPDDYGFGLYAVDGTLSYKNDYYRLDVIEVEKAYQTQRVSSLPEVSWSYDDRYMDLNGRYQTISSSYYQVNLIHLPVVTDYIITSSYCSFATTRMNFYGKLIGVVTQSFADIVVNWPHGIDGRILGSFYGNKQGSNVLSQGSISSPIFVSGSFNTMLSSSVEYSGSFTISGYDCIFDGLITILSPVSASDGNFNMVLSTRNSTSSIFNFLQRNSSGNLFYDNNSVQYRLQKSLQVVPENSKLLNGYFPTHYRFKRKTFSQKEVNAWGNTYDQSGNPIPVLFKWKRGSQTKKTTVDSSTGNLDNSDPIQITS